MARIAVIGGGASGMMTSIFASYGGVEVTLFEKNEKLGKKIYITGKGRCNVTNSCDKQVFLDNIVNGKMFMMSSASKWTSQDTMNFFTDRGLSLTVERGNRVFPTSNKASDVTKVLTTELKNLGVNVQLNCEISAVKPNENGVVITTIKGDEIFDAVVITCGGISYPTTGSSGDGYKFAKSIGHTIVKPMSALNEIITNQNVSALSGLSLKNVKLSALHNGKVVTSFLGEMLFTHKGISGPIALSMSSCINRLPLKEVELQIDLKPALPYKANTNGSLTIESRVNKDFTELANKSFKNSLVHLVPYSLAEYMVAASSIDENIKVNSLTAAQRKTVCDLLKKLTFTVNKLADVSLGIITSGGVSTAEVNPSTMQSKKNGRVYFAGECLDVDAFTGGFNMQVAFATGYVAGSSVAEKYLYD